LALIRISYSSNKYDHLQVDPQTFYKPVYRSVVDRMNQRKYLFTSQPIACVTKHCLFNHLG